MSCCRSLDPRLSWTVPETRSTPASWPWWSRWCSWKMTSTHCLPRSIPSLSRYTHLWVLETPYCLICSCKLKIRRGRPWLSFSHRSSFCCLQAVGITLRNLIQSVDEILPSLHYSVTTEVTFSVIFLLKVSLLSCSRISATIVWVAFQWFFFCLINARGSLSFILFHQCTISLTLSMILPVVHCFLTKKNNNKKKPWLPIIGFFLLLFFPLLNTIL